MIGEIKKFKFWCQKVLPLVYDDSLSYYEVLCKLVNYLNKVIEDVNSIPEYIDAVIDERLSDEHLKELIEEVVANIESAISSNNEGSNTNSSADYNIGQMLWWNGKLYRVIKKIDAGDTFIVDTNIALVNFEDLFNNFVDEVKHDITNNDDGTNTTASQNWKRGTWLWLNDVLYIVTNDITEGNAYVFSGNNANVKEITIEERYKVEYDASDKKITFNGDIADYNELGNTNYVDNLDAIDAIGNAINVLIRDRETTTLALENQGDIADANDRIDALITKVSNLGIYNVKDYGAVGDGTTDDTEAIQAATADANVTGGIIYFPQGNYYMTQPIVLKHHGTCVKGASPQSTYIHTDDESCILIDGTEDHKLSACSVKDISLYRLQNTAKTGKFGIRNNYNTNGTINNVIIEGFNFGLYNNHSGNTMIYTVGVVQRAYGATGFTFTNGSVSDMLMNCYVSNTGSNGGAVDNGTGIFCGGEHIGDLAIYYLDVANGGHGIWVDGTEMLSGYGGADFRFHNIVVDGNRSAAIYLNNIGGRGNVVIDGGWINPSIRAGSGGIEMHTVNNVAITNMIIQQLSDANPSNLYGIWGGNATYLSISNVIFKNIFGPISLASIDRVNIDNNQISVYDLSAAINTYGINLTTATNVIISGNSVSGSYIRGISADGDSIVCTSNIVKRATSAFNITASTTKVVSDNIPGNADIEKYEIDTGITAYKTGHVVTLCFANYAYAKTTWQPLITKWLPIDAVNAAIVDGANNAINRFGMLTTGNYRIITPNGSAYAAGTYSGTITYITAE